MPDSGKTLLSNLFEIIEPFPPDPQEAVAILGQNPVGKLMVPLNIERIAPELIARDNFDPDLFVRHGSLPVSMIIRPQKLRAQRQGFC